MNKKEFIKEIGRKYINAKDVYYDIVNLIVLTLNRDGEVDLPGLGKLEVRTRSPHKIRDVNSGDIKYTKKTGTIKFTPTKLIKEMFK